jgi:hypothetical protein
VRLRGGSYRAIYRDGQRVAEPRDLTEMAEACRDGGGMFMVSLTLYMVFKRRRWI